MISGKFDKFMNNELLAKLLNLIIDPSPEVMPIQLENRVHSNALLSGIFVNDKTYLLETEFNGYKVRSIGFSTSSSETDGSKNKPVLHLSPGGSRNAASLINLAFLLSQDFGIPTLVTDNPGMGYSDGVLKNQDIYTYAEALTAVVNAHFSGKSVVLGGHSKGGTVSQRSIFDAATGKVKYTFDVAGYISIASGAMNPLQEILRQGFKAIKSALRAVLSDGRTLPIPFFVGKHNPINRWKLAELYKAFGSEDSIKLTQGMKDLDSEAPTPEQVSNFLKTIGHNIPAQLIFINQDTVFPLEDEGKRPGALRRMRRWQSLGFGPAGLVFVKEDYGHSAPALYPDLFAPYIAQAYQTIMKGEAGQGENKLP